MKFFLKFLPIIILTVLIGSCKSEVQKKGDLYCDYPTGDSVKNELGRVYKWSDPSSGNSFFYIGNTNEKLKNGGFVPCNGFPKDFFPEQQLDSIVVYSGMVKLGRSAEEPIYFGIELTDFKKSKD